MRPSPAIPILTALLAVTLIACGGLPGPTPGVGDPTTPPTTEPTVTRLDPTQPATPVTQATPNAPADATSTVENREERNQASPPPGVVATVNDVPIPMADFQRQLTDARAFLLGQGLIDPDTEEGQAALHALREQVLDQLIDQLLIMQAAEEMGLTVSDDELEESIAKIRQDVGSDEVFAESLAANNLTEEQFRKLQRQQLISRKLIDAITADIPDTAVQVRARHILVRTREEAELVLKELDNGANFGDLAKEHSVDETSKDNGGDLGFFPRGVVLPEFEEAAFSLEVGERSGVVETPFGYHIIEVLGRGARPIPDEIKEGLRQQMITNWLEVQRAQTNIQRYLEP